MMMKWNDDEANFGSCIFMKLLYVLGELVIFLARKKVGIKPFFSSYFFHRQNLLSTHIFFGISYFFHTYFCTRILGFFFRGKKGIMHKIATPPIFSLRFFHLEGRVRKEIYFHIFNNNYWKIEHGFSKFLLKKCNWQFEKSNYKKQTNYNWKKKNDFPS